MLTAYFQAIYEVQLANGLPKKKESQRESNKNQRADNESCCHHCLDEQGRSRPSTYTYHRLGYHTNNCDCKSDRGLLHYKQHGCGSNNQHHNNGQVRKTLTTPKRVVNKPCPKHSREGKPAQHTLAKCRLNKANKKPTVNRHGHKAYVNNSHQPNTDESYDDHSHCSDFLTGENYGVVYKSMKFRACRVGKRVRQAKHPCYLSLSERNPYNC